MTKFSTVSGFHTCCVCQNVQPFLGFMHVVCVKMFNCFWVLYMLCMSECSTVSGFYTCCVCQNVQLFLGFIHVVCVQNVQTISGFLYMLCVSIPAVCVLLSDKPQYHAPPTA